MPPAAIAADLFAIALVVAGGLAVSLDRYRFSIAGVAIRVSSPWRAWVVAAVVLAVRIWLVPRLPDLGIRRRLLLDEDALFETEHLGLRRRFMRLAGLLVAFAALVAALTWPQMRRMDGVPDLGDPLFSIWRIGWINHQILRDPLRLFDANIFYPERLTLAYSDSMIAPALASAPLLWFGLSRVVAYNLIFLSGFVLSGVTMYVLVRALIGRWEPAIVAGAIFALYPYRYEHYSHLELQMAMWMPLALWGLHRAMARGRLRDGLLTGIAYALQMLSSMYYGMYFAVYLVVIGLVLWIGRRFPIRPLAVLAAGAALAAVLIFPVASRYWANQSMMGVREASTVEYYSAQGIDYLKPHFRSLVYGRWAGGGHPERQLFPRIAPIVLAGVALWPPLSVARIGYATALALTLDGSLGVNGKVFPWLKDHVPGYSGLRVPARFSLLAGMTLAILSGFGILRLIQRWPKASRAVTGIVLAAVLFEALPNIRLERVWPEPPAVYASLPGTNDVVLAEFPMSSNLLSYFPDTRFEYFSTFHWHPLVNGDSGFSPPSYEELLDKERPFPFEDSVDYLRRRGVTHITLNGAFTNPGRYQYTAQLLDARQDLELVAVSPWEGSEVRLYRFR